MMEIIFMNEKFRLIAILGQFSFFNFNTFDYLMDGDIIAKREYIRKLLLENYLKDVPLKKLITFTSLSWRNWQRCISKNG